VAVDAATETIRWGICGTGAIARSFVMALDNVPDAEVVAVEVVGERDGSERCSAAPQDRFDLAAHRQHGEGVGVEFEEHGRRRLDQHVGPARGLEEGSLMPPGVAADGSDGQRGGDDCQSGLLPDAGADRHGCEGDDEAVRHREIPLGSEGRRCRHDDHEPDAEPHHPARWRERQQEEDRDEVVDDVQLIHRGLRGPVLDDQVDRKVNEDHQRGDEYPVLTDGFDQQRQRSEPDVRASAQFCQEIRSMGRFGPSGAVPGSVHGAPKLGAHAFDGGHDRFIGSRGRALRARPIPWGGRSGPGNG